MGISIMKREKMRLEDNIRRMEINQKRLFGEDVERKPQTSPPMLTPAPTVTKSESPQKRTRSGSFKRSPEHKDRQKEDGQQEDPYPHEHIRDRDTRPKKVDARSRLMFGKLIGHLQSAKKRLELEKGWKSTELNLKAVARLEQKLTHEKTNIKELRKRQFEQQRREEELKVAQIEKNIEEKEILLLQRRLEGHYSLMMNFIRTKAEPTIFYLPAKHTKDTDHVLEETRAAIKHKIASLKVQLQPLPLGFEEPESNVVDLGRNTMDPEEPICTPVATVVPDIETLAPEAETYAREAEIPAPDADILAEAEAGTAALQEVEPPQDVELLQEGEPSQEVEPPTSGTTVMELEEVAGIHSEVIPVVDAQPLMPSVEAPETPKTEDLAQNEEDTEPKRKRQKTEQENGVKDGSGCDEGDDTDSDEKERTQY